MFETPVRLEMKAIFRPSADHCGEMLLPIWSGIFSTSPVARSYSASCWYPNVSVLKSVTSPRSVEKAIFRPSGDHTGSRSV